MNERVDLVDKDGVVQVSSVSRAEYNADRDAYPDRYMQIIVAVIINPAGKVLLHERAKGKSEEGLIDLLSETVQAGEKPAQAIVRGLAEETGITLEANEIPVLVHAGVNEYNRYRSLYYVQLISDRTPVVMEPEAAVWFEWRSLAEIETTDDAALVEGLRKDVAAALSIDNPEPSQ